MKDEANSEGSLIEEKLPTSSKFAFGGVTVASGVLNGIVFAAITFFYNVKLGLSEDLIGWAWLIFAFWNTINDPLLGFIQDRTKSKWGRRIPYLRFGAPVYTFLFILCWIPFVDVTSQMALFFNLLIMLFTFDTLFTMIGLITYSLPAEMAISAKARSNLMIYGSIFSALGSLLTFVLPVLFLTGDNTPGVDPTFIIAMSIIGLICGVIIFASSYFIKENKYTQLEEPLGFFAGIGWTFRNKAFIIFEISNFSFVLGQTILTTSVFYYLDFVLQLDGVMSMVPLLLFFVMVFAFTYVFHIIVVKIGLKKTYILSLTISAASFVLVFIIGWTLIYAVIALIFLGMGFSGIFLTSQAVFAEVVDNDEVRTSKRRETTYAGMNALITKPAISIANAAFLGIIMLFGFQNEAPIQTPEAQFGIMIGFAVLPAIFIIIGAIAIIFFPLDGPKWDKKKLELKKIHEEKEREYLKRLKDEGKM